jgi:hypothetical protein
VNDLLARESREPLRRELWRLSIGALAVALAAVAWHALRPAAERVVAAHSIGFQPLQPLIEEVAGLERTYGSAFFMRRGPGWACVTSTDFDRRVRWYDENLRLSGNYQIGGWDPGDWDRDGCFESRAFITQLAPVPGRFPRDAVLRLRNGRHEIVLLYRNDFTLHWTWGDPDVDGVCDFYCFRAGGPRMQRVARFQWNHPGGVLVPVELPADGSVKFWSPPDGVPLPVDADSLTWDALEAAIPELKDW